MATNKEIKYSESENIFNQEEIYKDFRLGMEDRNTRLILPLENNLVLLNTRTEQETSRYYSTLNLANLGLKGFSIPQIAKYKASKKLTDRIWKNMTPFHSISNLSIGNTRKGNKVIIVSHNEDHPSNSVEFQKAILEDSSKIMPLKGFDKSYLKFKQKDFQNLLDNEDGENIFVLDYEKVNKQMPKESLDKFESWKPQSIEEALENPLIIPLFQSEENAREYLRKAVEMNDFGGIEGYEEYDRKLVFITPLIETDTPVVSPLELNSGNIEVISNVNSAVFKNTMNYLCTIKDIKKFKKEFKKYES